MAIQTISQLDAFDNGTNDTITELGGKLRMFSGGGITKSDESSDKPTDPTHCNFPEYSKLKGEHNTSLNGNSGTFYSSLLEMSVPVDVGDAGIDSAMFNSRKIAYRDLVKNIIIDTKAYLNRRNNLGEFNLCALAYANYEYKGHKKFLSGPDEGKADGDYSDRGVDIQGKLSVVEDCVFDSSLIVAKDLSIGGNLSADSGEIHAISAYFSIVSVTDSLTVTRNISAGNDISATNNIYAGNDITATKNISAGNDITATKNISAGNDITATGNISAQSASFSSLSVSGVADLTAEHAKWSDLAEYYLADKKYEPGTLVHFSGQAELTVARKKANAVVTTNPAFLMNCAMRDMQSSCAIALAGRVPVRVVGKVKKFDKLVLSDVPGVARARKRIEFWKKPIGIALENSAQLEQSKVECVVMLSF